MDVQYRPLALKPDRAMVVLLAVSRGAYVPWKMEIPGSKTPSPSIPIAIGQNVNRDGKLQVIVSEHLLFCDGTLRIYVHFP